MAEGKTEADKMAGYQAVVSGTPGGEQGATETPGAITVVPYGMAWLHEWVQEICPFLCQEPGTQGEQPFLGREPGMQAEWPSLDWEPASRGMDRLCKHSRGRMSSGGPAGVKTG